MYKSKYRAMLEAAHNSPSADYNTSELQAQAATIDLNKLGTLIDELLMHSSILAHCSDVLRSGECVHPLQAFMHAVQCPTLPLPDGGIDDKSFDALFTAWVRLTVGAGARMGPITWDDAERLFSVFNRSRE